MEKLPFEEALNSMTDEEFQKILKEVEHLENTGPTVDEYLAYVNHIK